MFDGHSSVDLAIAGHRLLSFPCIAKAPPPKGARETTILKMYWTTPFLIFGWILLVIMRHSDCGILYGHWIRQSGKKTHQEKVSFRRWMSECEIEAWM